MDQAYETPAAEHGGTIDWPLRPVLLGGIGLAAGLIAHLLLGDTWGGNVGPLRLAGLSFVVLAAGLTGFTLERRLWWASLAFALAVALVGALVVYWNGDPDGWSASESWRMVSLLLAIAIAAPLFQAARDEGALRFPYASVHDHAWTNVVLWAACWVFVAIVFALAWLLAMLFGLIKIDVLRHLLEKEWFWRALIGFAFGAGLGLLREHDGVVRLLQRVVAMVLAVLAPVLAVGLVLFVVALPFTGLQALWDATSATTPILLCCVVGALILANAVIGNMPEQERRFPALRYGALGLAVVALPLALLAAVATGLRIGQYGFTPERLWALVFVILASAYGLAYLVSVVLGRQGWAARVRVANLRLAFGVLGVALLLATPVVSFNALSTRDQVARLESGKVASDKFDWRALAFDFGEPGRTALKRLQGSANATIKARANQVAKAEGRYDVPEAGLKEQRRAELVANLRILPRGRPMPDGLLDHVAERHSCGPNQKCTALLVSDGEALLFRDGCFGAPEPKPKLGSAAAIKAASTFDCRTATRYVREGAAWGDAGSSRALSDAEATIAARGYADDRLEIRTIPRRQVFAGGVPVGDAFE